MPTLHLWLERERRAEDGVACAPFSGSFHVMRNKVKQRARGRVEEAAERIYLSAALCSCSKPHFLPIERQWHGVRDFRSAT